MEAFGPFGGRVEIDFDHLVDVGLFVISGPTGAGKTSIFDGLCFALYGALSGARGGHTDVRSDHADPAVECQIWFEFEVDGDRWRVWRRPAQTMKKLRGDGTTERPAKALLERWVGGAWEPSVDKVRDVTTACHQLVGLTLEQFQRVVLLPQGKFQDVLNAGSSARAELLRTLFGSEIFDRTAEILKARAKELHADVAGVEERREYLRSAAADRLRVAEEALEAVGAEIEERREAGDWVGPVAEGVGAHGSLDGDPSGEPEQQILELDTPERGADAGSAELAAWCERLRSDRVAPLRILVDEVSEQARSLTTDFVAARSQALAVRQRTELQQRLAELELERPNRERERERVDAGLRAAPVLALLERQRAVAEAQHTLVSTTENAMFELREAIEAMSPFVGDDERARLLGLLAADSGSEQDALVDALAEHRRTAAALVDAAAQLQRDELELTPLRASIDDTDKALADLAERQQEQAEHLTRLAAQIEEANEAGSSLASLELRAEQLATRHRARQELHAIERRRSELIRELDELRASRERMEAVHRALTEQRSLDEAARASLPAKERELELAVQRLSDRTAIADLSGRLAELTARDRAASEKAQQLFERFVAGAAPRLASSLTEAEPCPVCGSIDHPAPALPADDAPVPVEHTQVAEANAAAGRARQELTEVRTELGALIDRAGDLSGVELGDLEAATTQARSAVAEAVAAGEAAERAQTEVVRLDRQLAEVDQAIEERTERLLTVESDRSERIGLLGPDAEGSLADSEQQASEAAAELTAARQAASRRGELEGAREAATTAIECDRVKERELTAHRASIVATLDERASQLARRQSDHDRTLGGLPAEQPLAWVEQAVGAASAWRSAVAERTRVGQQRADVDDQLRAALSRSGFGTECEALAAAVSPDDLADAQAGHQDWLDAVKTTTATLAALAEQQLPDEPPDLAELERASTAAAGVAAGLNDRLNAAVSALERGAEALLEIEAIDSESADAQRTYEIMARVAGVVSGKNSRRITLENWVLAAYLRDVVDHANLHLATMSAHRYQLVVLDEARDQRGQHGLDLAVDDAFTGRSRPTVSLSGGESFQAALALALGLADVVGASRGGVHVEALFVDEGFGSLDATAIDQAIDVLDGLRSRGAMVGVITHVEAMKSALPVALEVRPRSDRAGSEVLQLV